MMLVGAFHAVVWWDREGFWKWFREAKIANDFKMALANPASTVAADKNAVHFFIIILQRWRCLAKSGLKEMHLWASGHFNCLSIVFFSMNWGGSGNSVRFSNDWLFSSRRFIRCVHGKGLVF